MRPLLVWAIVAACGGGTSSTGDGGGDGAPGGTKVTVTLHSVPADHGMFSYIAAYQDGTGQWVLAPPPSGDTYTFYVKSPTWGFAYTCQVTIATNGIPNNYRDVVEYHFAVGERADFTDDLAPRCTDKITYVALTGNVANRASSGFYVAAYNGRAVFVNTTTGDFTLLVPPGTHDLIVMHGISRNVMGDFLADGAFVQRDVAVNSPMMVNVNGQSTVGTQLLGVNVGSPQSAQAATILFTANGTIATLVHLTTNPLQTMALNGAQAAAGDLYDQRLTVTTVTNQPVTVTNATATPTTQTFPSQTAPLGAATVTKTTGTPYPILKTTWPTYPAAIGYTWTMTQTPVAAGCSGFNACTITWSAWLSPGAVGSSPSYTMPDLSKVPGWKPALQLVPGTGAGGDVTALTSSAGAMDCPSGIPTVGTQRVYAHALLGTTP